MGSANLSKIGCFFPPNRPSNGQHLHAQVAYMRIAYVLYFVLMQIKAVLTKNQRKLQVRNVIKCMYMVLR